MIDAHCHLSDSRRWAEVEHVLTEGGQAGVRQFVLGGVDAADWERQRQLAKKYPGQVQPVYGVHPWVAAQGSRSDLASMLNELRSWIPSAVGVGETGLDFGKKWPKETWSQQEWVFREHLALAREFAKPLVLHVVRAHSLVLEILEKNDGGVRGMVHSFTADAATLDRYVRLGFFISVGPSIFRDPARFLANWKGRLPLQKLLLETDWPDQTSDFSTLARLSENFASFYSLSLEEVQEVSRQNAKNLFRI